MGRVIDAKGMPCPQPVIKAKEALKEMTAENLEVLVDNEMAVQNLMKLGNYSGLQTSSEKLSDEEFRVIFHADGQTEHENHIVEKVEMDEICTCVSQPANSVVVLSADQMGSGDEELGRILMKGFVYALTQMETLPSTVLLYNGGARLSVEGAETLEDLKNLEEQGVEILTCGTCLNYYGLSDKLKVGGVTNMYEIVERMTKAGSVIRP